MHIHQRGKSGEELASAFLQAAGYTILEQNWKFGRNELDIVCLSPAGVLVFVEVKTRRDEKFGFPEQAVDYRKEKAVSAAARAYLAVNKHSGELRFDVISVILPEGAVGENQITHIQDAFFPGF